jgi:amidase
MNKEIRSWSAQTLAKKIQAQEISITAVVTCYLNQIDQLNPSINAISHFRDRAAVLKEAKEKDVQLKNGIAKGTLFGIPVTIKESFLVKGLRVSNGDPLLRKYMATEDAELVKRLKDAGAIILGMTNVPLFCIDWQSTNFWNGQTNNPHDLTRVAGGSSGGSSAAIAAQFSPISIGSDAGGSIRVPAHFCGICGLRPTEGLLSNRGHLKNPNKPQGRRHIVVPGPFANKVEDLILLMQVLANYKAYPLPEMPPVDFNSSSWEGQNLDIAVSESINNTPIDAEYLAIFRNFIHQLKTSQHKLQYDHPDYNEKEAYLNCSKIIGFEMGMNSLQVPFLNVFLYLFILFKYRDPLWAKGMAQGQNLSNRAYAKAMDAKDDFSEVYHNFLSNYDIWITPVCAMEAYKHQRAGIPFNINGQKIPYTKAIASFNFTTAYSGHPILVIPIGKKKNGLPVGIQIHAKKWTDRRLLQIGQYLEQLAVFPNN